MRRSGTSRFITIALMMVFVVSAVGQLQAVEKKLTHYKALIIKPFESSVKGAYGLPAATHDAVTQALKESAMFNEVMTPADPKKEVVPPAPAKKDEMPVPTGLTATVKDDEAKPKLEEAKLVTAIAVVPVKPVRTLVLDAKLVDFEPGSAAKRLLVGFGTGRAHAGFEFSLKDAETGEVIWTKVVKQTASFWFNGTTSSAAERSELPEGVAKKFMEELKKVMK